MQVARDLSSLIANRRNRIGIKSSTLTQALLIIGILPEQHLVCLALPLIVSCKLCPVEPQECLASALAPKCLFTQLERTH